MERYFTNGGNMEITDALTEGLLRTVMGNTVILHSAPDNYEVREEVMWAVSLAHLQVFNRVGDNHKSVSFAQPTCRETFSLALYSLGEQPYRNRKRR